MGAAAMSTCVVGGAASLPPIPHPCLAVQLPVTGPSAAPGRTAAARSEQPASDETGVVRRSASGLCGSTGGGHGRESPTPPRVPDPATPLTPRAAADTSTGSNGSFQPAQCFFGAFLVPCRRGTHCTGDPHPQADQQPPEGGMH